MSFIYSMMKDFSNRKAFLNWTTNSWSLGYDTDLNLLKVFYILWNFYSYLGSISNVYIF